MPQEIEVSPAEGRFRLAISKLAEAQAHRQMEWTTSLRGQDTLPEYRRQFEEAKQQIASLTALLGPARAAEVNTIPIIFDQRLTGQPSPRERLTPIELAFADAHAALLLAEFAIEKLGKQREAESSRLPAAEKMVEKAEEELEAAAAECIGMELTIRFRARWSTLPADEEIMGHLRDQGLVPRAAELREINPINRDDHLWEIVILIPE